MSHRFEHKLEHTLESKPADNADGGAVTTVRRIELITGTGRRRQWSADDKARIVVESLKPGANVSEVARRHGLSPQQLFGWRRQARELLNESGMRRSAPRRQVLPRLIRRDVHARAAAGRSRAGVRLAQSLPSRRCVVATHRRPRLSPAPADTVMPGVIEIAIGDAIVRVRGQVETGLLIAVLRAVRRAS